MTTTQIGATLTVGRVLLRTKEGEALWLSPIPMGEGTHRGRNLAPGSTGLFLIDEHPEA